MDIMYKFSKGPQPLSPEEVTQQVTQPQDKMSLQEQMMMRMLKQLIPGFDPSVIQKLGSDVQAGVEYFKQAVVTIEAQNAEILRRLERIEHASSSAPLVERLPDATHLLAGPGAGDNNAGP